VAGADLVITGEGAFDASSLAGKAPMQVMEMCQASGVRVEVISGRAASGVTSLQDLAGSASEAMAEPGRWLREATRQIVTKVAVP
jgi:glycerate kinase